MSNQVRIAHIFHLDQLIEASRVVSPTFTENHKRLNF